MKRAKNRLHKLKQSSPVSECLVEFRNLTLSIPNANVGEKVHRFVEGLQRSIRAKVMKGHTNFFDKCARVALKEDSALWRADERGRDGLSALWTGNTPNLMDISNKESSQGQSNTVLREDRKNDLHMSCFF